MRTASEVKRIILPILKEHGVVKAAIFGSTARGDAGMKSDVDILVKFRETPSLFDIGGLYADLKEKLGQRPDIVTYGSVNSKLRPFILKDKIDIL